VTNDIGWLESAKNWAILKSIDKAEYEITDKTNGDIVIINVNEFLL